MQENEVSWCSTSTNASKVMERVQIEVIEIYGRNSPFYSTATHKFRLVMSVIDCFSKHCWLVPLETKQALSVAETLCSLFRQFGCPHLLQSDNGKEFVAKVVKELCCKLNIHGRPYHPQSQGQVENLNKRVKKSLASLLLRFPCEDQGNIWPWLVDEAAQLLNNTYNDAIKDVPFRVFFGRDSSQFGINNTSDLFSITPKDSDILLSSECEDIAHCDKDIDGLDIEFETSDLQGIPKPQQKVCREIQNPVSDSMRHGFLELCIATFQEDKGKP